MILRCLPGRHGADEGQARDGRLPGADERHLSCWRREMTEKKTRAKAEADGKRNFEDSLGRLEKIVAEMEGGSLSLDAMVARFEEGQKLIEFCTKTLNEVERKIEKLVKKGDGVAAEPFGDEDAEEESDDGELF